MSRIEDRAIDNEQNILIMRINHIIEFPLITENISGMCWNCDEQIGTKKRFCDEDCRDDFQKRCVKN
jgi:hypothetical protein